MAHKKLDNFVEIKQWITWYFPTIGSNPSILERSSAEYTRIVSNMSSILRSLLSKATNLPKMYISLKSNLRSLGDSSRRCFVRWKHFWYSWKHLMAQKLFRVFAIHSCINTTGAALWIWLWAQCCTRHQILFVCFQETFLKCRLKRTNTRRCVWGQLPQARLCGNCYLAPLHVVPFTWIAFSETHVRMRCCTVWMSLYYNFLCAMLFTHSIILLSFVQFSIFGATADSGEG